MKIIHIHSDIIGNCQLGGVFRWSISWQSEQINIRYITIFEVISIAFGYFCLRVGFMTKGSLIYLNQIVEIDASLWFTCKALKCKGRADTDSRTHQRWATSNILMRYISKA